MAYVIRDIRPVISSDLCELLELGDLRLNVLVGNGDVVGLPEAKLFHVIGFAGDPGSFSLKKPTPVFEGIAVARGFQEVEASKKKCAEKRKTPEGEHIIPVDLVAVGAVLGSPSDPRSATQRSLQLKKRETEPKQVESGQG